MKGLFARFPHAMGSALALKYPTDKGTGKAREATPGPPACLTDGAVLAIPAGATFTLAVAAGPMLGTARVAGPLVAGCPHPAFLTAAGAPHTHSMAPTVGSTDLCGEEVVGPGETGEGGERKKISTEQVVAGNKSHTWLPSLASGSSQGSRGWGS